MGSSGGGPTPPPTDNVLKSEGKGASFVILSPQHQKRYCFLLFFGTCKEGVGVDPDPPPNVKGGGVVGRPPPL